jgi:hypothetical protein
MQQFQSVDAKELGIGTQFMLKTNFAQLIAKSGQVISLRISGIYAKRARAGNKMKTPRIALFAQWTSTSAVRTLQRAFLCG